MRSQDTTIAALYCRLSRDDNNGSQESMSIENQRQILLDYAAHRRWTVCDIYTDDGYSGTNFDRPDFKRMLRDAEAGKFNCIVAKDSSRFGRNYIEVGRYTEQILPRLGIRFITVNGGIDTHAENDFAPFLFFFDEHHARETSRKVRQVKSSRASQGKFMGSQAPYGYVKSLEDKHKLVIDGEAASFVRRMFSEYAGGDSARMIAGRLNEEGVDSPQVYHDKKEGRVILDSGKRPLWGSCTVIQLLRNQAYIGDLVQGKREVVSFKSTERRLKDPEDWIVVKGTHEAIIDRELWEKAHSKLGRRENARKTKKDSVGLFSGKIYCSDCKSPLAYMRKSLKNGEKGVYRCSRYNNNGVEACTSHYIDESFLAAFVLNDVRLYARLAVAEREQLTKRLLREMSSQHDVKSKALLAHRAKNEKRLLEIASRMKDLFEEKCKGTLSAKVLITMTDAFEKEQCQLEEEQDILAKQIHSAKNTEDEVSGWIDLIERQLDIKELDRITAMELIDCVEVSEARDVNGERRQEVSILYRFVGNLQGHNKKSIA